MMDEKELDIRWMERAIALGERGRFTAPPNPWVGSIVVCEGELKGQGWHVEPGTPHAEVVALEAAGRSAKGATLYVTLEPCCHDGQTGPCTVALLRAGIARVVVGIEDPDPKMRGRGIAALKKAGIEVEVGIAKEAVRHSLLPYLHHRQTGRPYCIAKAAISIDGRIAAADHSSHWISGPEARAEVHVMRARSGAVLVGVGTALADRPRLTARTDPPPPHQPLRIVVDSKGRFADATKGWAVATTKQVSSDQLQTWERQGAELFICDAEEGLVSMDDLFCQLGERGILQLIVEGGGKIYGDLLRREMIDEFHIFVGPIALGSRGTPLFAGALTETIGDAPRLKLRSVERLGESVHLVYGRLEDGS